MGKHMKFRLLYLLCSVAVVFSTTGCASYVTGRYSISADNAVALRALNGMKLNVGEFTDETNGSIMSCNYKGNIATMDGESYSQFIRKALMTELKFADVYSKAAPVTITGRLDSFDNSTAFGTDLTFVMTISSSKGRSVTIKEKYYYNGSVFGTASSTCGALASAFVPAVQNLVGKIIDEIQNSLI
jgi:hypothetical protein